MCMKDVHEIRKFQPTVPTVKYGRNAKSFGSKYRNEQASEPFSHILAISVSKALVKRVINLLLLCFSYKNQCNKMLS